MAWLRLFCVAALLPTVLGACDSKVEDPDDEVAAPDGDTDTDGDTEEETDTDVDEETDTDPGTGTNPGTNPGTDPPENRPDAAVPCEPSDWEGSACTTEDGQAGTSFCIVVDGVELDTPCSTEPAECVPGDSYDMGCVGDICYWDGEAFRRYSWSEPNCETPLVVSFDGAPIEYMPAVAASFDLSPDGTCMSSDWPSAPWLALDRDGDGFIRSSSELFGSATKMSSGGYAPHGFAALAELDSDHDGKITARDERFGELVLWSDLDDDRVGSFSELRPLHETSLVSIDLSFDRRASCDRHGNCGLERAALEYRTAQGGLAFGEVVDVHLGCQ